MIVLLAILCILNIFTPQAGAVNSLSKLEEFTLSKTTDGDSFVLKKLKCKTNLQNDCTEKIRLIGIDTPEMAQGKWGKEAKKFSDNLLLNAQKILVENDIEERDIYGRMLAYVYIQPKIADHDLLMLNRELLKNGFAELYTRGMNRKYLTEFKVLEAQARKAKLNIWQDKGGLKISPVNFRAKHRRE